MRISDWSSDVCSSDLADPRLSGQMQSTNLGNRRTQQQMATDAAIAPWALRQAKASSLAAEVGLQDKVKPKIDPATAGRLANLKVVEKQMGRIPIGRENGRTPVTNEQLLRCLLRDT